MKEEKIKSLNQEIKRHLLLLISNSTMVASQLLLLIGFGNNWEPLMNDKPNNLTWWNERTDVDAFYQAMDLFLFTSRGSVNDKETMPLVIRIMAIQIGSCRQFWILVKCAPIEKLLV